MSASSHWFSLRLLRPNGPVICPPFLLYVLFCQGPHNELWPCLACGRPLLEGGQKKAACHVYVTCSLSLSPQVDVVVVVVVVVVVALSPHVALVCVSCLPPSAIPVMAECRIVEQQLSSTLDKLCPIFPESSKGFANEVLQKSSKCEMWEERKEAKTVLFLREHFSRKADDERHSRGGREREVSEGRKKGTKSWLSFSPSGKSLQAFAETMLLLLALQHTLKGEFGSVRTRYITKKTSIPCSGWRPYTKFLILLQFFLESFLSPCWLMQNLGLINFQVH